MLGGILGLLRPGSPSPRHNASTVVLCLGNAPIRRGGWDEDRLVLPSGHMDGPGGFSPARTRSSRGLRNAPRKA
jgi:hypothetical protein